MEMSSWDELVCQALSILASKNTLFSLRPVRYPLVETADHAFQLFDHIREQDRASVEVQISESTFQKWLNNVPSSGDDELTCGTELPLRKLLLFSGNDYLALTSHPSVLNAASKALHEHGMGPRAAALTCGYTSYHKLLESSLAKSKHKEDSLLCPTGFSANLSLMSAIGYLGSLEDGIAIFSDDLNHASIIDGIRLAQRQGNLQLFVYKHCDMIHLDELLSDCKMKRKLVVTDTLFSMDGDIAPMVQLSKLRKKHNFFLVIDDAHGSLIFGKNGGGIAEEFNCASDVDICIGTLSKAVGCNGGFIACSKRWKQLIQSTGRAYVYSTATTIPIAAAAHAAMVVGKKETWRRKALWNRVQEFRTMTGIPITSPIISLIIGSEEKTMEASRHMMKCGFHINAIRPPVVPPNLCRLRIILSAAHSRDDIKKLTTVLSQCINLSEIGSYYKKAEPKL